MLIDNLSLHPQLPSLWKSALTYLHNNGAPEAIIAGGALRDIYLGGTIKDVDIFINASAPVHYDFTPILEHISNPESAIDDKSVISQGTYNYLGDPTLFNIIRCSQDIAPLARFDKFDFGICKVAYATQWIIHPEFLYDVKHQQMTLTRADSINSFLQSIQRYKRFRQKYLWPLVIPSTLKLNVES